MGGTQSRRDGTGAAAGTGGNSANQQEEFTVPLGLYQRCSWDPKTLKQLIFAKKLSPLHPGKEEPDADGHAEECPICFLFYSSGLNRSLCCKKGICTECFLQVKKPRIDAICPFCNKTPYSVVYSGPLSSEERQKEHQEQQKVLELKIKIRAEEVENDRLREKEREARLSLQLSSSPSSTTSVSNSLLSTSPPYPESSTSPMNSPGGSLNASGVFPRGRHSLQPVAQTEDSSTSPTQYSTSYPGNKPNMFGNKEEVDLEELMLLEAIRLSLMSTEKDGPVSEILSNEPKSESSTPSLSSRSSVNDETQEELELALAISMSLQK